MCLCMCYSWCGDGSLLATGSRDGLCKIWSITDTASTADAAQGNNLMYLLVFLPGSISFSILITTFIFIFVYVYLSSCLNLCLKQTPDVIPPTIFPCIFSRSVRHATYHRLYCTYFNYTIGVYSVLCLVWHTAPRLC